MSQCFSKTYSYTFRLWFRIGSYRCNVNHDGYVKLVMEIKLKKREYILLTFIIPTQKQINKINYDICDVVMYKIRF